MKLMGLIFGLLLSANTFAAPQVLKDNEGKLFGIENASVKSPQQGRTSVEQAQLDVCLGKDMVESITSRYQCYEAAATEPLSPACDMSFVERLCELVYPEPDPCFDPASSQYCRGTDGG